MASSRAGQGLARDPCLRAGLQGVARGPTMCAHSFANLRKDRGLPVCL
jgi:hypothetical protein